MCTGGARTRHRSSSGARDIFREIADSRVDRDGEVGGVQSVENIYKYKKIYCQYENPVTGVRYRTPSRTRVGDTGYTRYREQSSSPDRGAEQQRCRYTITIHIILSLNICNRYNNMVCYLRQVARSGHHPVCRAAGAQQDPECHDHQQDWPGQGSAVQSSYEES